MIKVKPLYKRIMGLPKLISYCWEFTDHVKITLYERLRFTLTTIIIVLK